MGKIIGVVSGKGGVGKTTLVANLALSLKEFGERIAAIDCNITTPHLSFYLGAYDYPVTLNDVLRGDAAISTASYYHNGIFIVPASQNIDDLADIDILNLKDRLEGLEGLVDIILLDSAPGLGREALSVLQASDEVIFVTTPSLPALNDVLKCGKLIEKLDLKTLGIVLNMVRNEKYELKEKEVGRITGLPVLSKIPFDKDILKGLSVKAPFVEYRPNSSASVECKRLAANLLGVEPIARKNIFSGIYGALKRMTSFGRPSSIGIESLGTDEVMKTDADRILDLVKVEGLIKMSEVSRRLDMQKKDVETLVKILEDHQLIELDYPVFGEVRLGVKR